MTANKFALAFPPRFKNTGIPSFCRYLDGEVLQADCNAARNIETRLDDPEIKRFMKSIDVRKILIRRTVSFLSQRDVTLGDAIKKGWFDPRHLKGIGKEARVESETLVA